MTVSDSEADKLKDTNKLPAGEMYAQIHRIKLIANGYNQIHILTVLKHAELQLSLCFYQTDFYLNHKPNEMISLSEADILHTYAKLTFWLNQLQTHKRLKQEQYLL